MSRKFPVTLIALLVYLVIAILVTYPLILNLSTALVGYVHGDAYEMAHHIWWIKHALQTGQNPFFAANLAYPDGINGVTLWSHPLQFFPAWLLAFVLPLPVAANVTILLTVALNGTSMFWLVKYLTAKQKTLTTENTERETQTPPRPLERGLGGEVISAFIAGLIFMLYPTMQGHLGAGHAGLMVQWGVPILIYALYRLRDGWRYVFLAAVAIELSVSGHILQLIYVVLPLMGVYALWLLLRREFASLLRLLAAGVIGGAVALIFALPSATAAVGTAAYEETGDTVRYSADLLAIVTPSFNHPLFGRLPYTHTVLGINLDEGALYLGVIAGLLALVALIRVPKARVWGWIGLLAWILSLGVLLKIFDQPVSLSADAYRSYIPMPFALVADLPIFNLARTPGRFGFLLAAAVAILAGYGVTVLWGWLRRPAFRVVVALIVGAVIVFEYQTFFPLPMTTAAVPAGVAALADRADVRAIFSAPWNNLVAAKTDLYWQTAHQHALIAGQVTRQTPVNPAKLNLLETFDPALLQDAGADVVLVHRDFDDGSLEAAARTQLGAPFYEDERVALFNTPDADHPETLTFTLPPEGEISNTADIYLHAPERGCPGCTFHEVDWIVLTATLTGETRTVTLLLDDVPVHRWQVDGAAPIRVPLPVFGYSTVRFALDPACPINTDPALECHTVALSDPAVEFVDAPPILEIPSDHRFDRGVALSNWHVPATITSGDPLPVWLEWTLQQARSENDIRYVHVLDANGTLVGQQDNTLGVQPARSAWAEEVTINFENPLSEGEYHVFVGWYTYPEIAPFCVLNAEGSCAANEVEIGTFQVGG
ncbi:MAG: hypothetical protein IPO91_29905 [Chloroflexi bacterium]|nr:hypothetical protein [Chloroflexota bacterium]